MRKVPAEIYYIISKEFNGSINSIETLIGHGWYKVNYGIDGKIAVYNIVNDKIVNTYFE